MSEDLRTLIRESLKYVGGWHEMPDGRFVSNRESDIKEFHEQMRMHGIGPESYEDIISFDVKHSDNPYITQTDVTARIKPKVKTKEEEAQEEEDRLFQSEDRPPSELNYIIERIASGKTLPRHIPFFARALSRAGLSKEQYQAIGLEADEGFYKKVADGLVRVNFDATKESLKDGIQKAFPLDTPKAREKKKEVEKSSVMAKKKEVPTSEEKRIEQKAGEDDRPVSQLNDAIEHISSGKETGRTSRYYSVLERALSRAALSKEQLEAIGAAKEGVNLYKKIADGLVRVNFDATKESLKNGIQKAFGLDIRKVRVEKEKAERGAGSKKKVRTAASIVTNTKATVDELKGSQDAFLSAWLASQGINGGAIEAFKTPMSPEVGLRWGDGGGTPSRVDGKANVALNEAMSQDVESLYLGATDEDGQPTFQLADPKSIQSTQEKSLQSMPLVDFADLERSLASAASKANSELWNGFWENMPQEAIAGFIQQPSSLPVIAWKALAARFKKLNVKKDTSPKEIADKIKAELDRQNEAISKATGNARGSKVSALKAAMPANVLDVMSQAKVGDDLSGQALTWQELLEQVGVQEIPFQPIPMSNESLKRMGVNPDQDERGVFFDALDFLPNRNVNPKEKKKPKSKKKKSPAKSKKHGPYRSGGDLLELLIELLEYDEETTEEELEAFLEAIGSV